MRHILIASLLVVACGTPEPPPEEAPRVDPSGDDVASPAEPTAAVGDAVTDPSRCPPGTTAVMTHPRRCAPCAYGRPCPCSGPVYRCETPAPPPPPPTGPVCGSGTCAAGEACCTIDCAGTQGCAPRAACPALECAQCPAGTCRRRSGGPCETPTGQTGNACCGCGADGLCSDPCRCAALDTPIATPDGSRPIASLRPGDLVISVDHGQRVAVPIVRVHRAPAIGHHVVRVELDTGAALRMSPGHPTADGRTFADLRAGDEIDGVRIVSVSVEPYEQGQTADILPASDTGTYVAAGVLVGSTLTAATHARAAR